MQTPPKKLIIGWFSFTCSTDSTILMTELLNQHWQQWKNLIEFRYAKILRPQHQLGPMDIAFVEGAISSKTEAEKLKHIRSLSKVLVAIGACAVTGQPSAQRNQFTPSQNQEIKAILERFQYADKVQKVSDVVTVDHSVPGCPMDEEKFINLINQLIAKNK
jgi:coenzyme F420-reducing hydrogenase gamma subunit